MLENRWTDGSTLKGDYVDRKKVEFCKKEKMFFFAHLNWTFHAVVYIEVTR